MNDIFRFASFEADRERYQLRRGIRAIKLERLPLELLFLLLEQGGRLVTREQIAAKLWGEHAFLDTERSINTAIRKVRRALEDDPRQPQFIETVVGKGYRFMAPAASDSGNRNLENGVQLPVPQLPDIAGGQSSEIRLLGFRVENHGGPPVLTCDVVVSNVSLGRLALLELELPVSMTLPLKAEDRLLLKLHGVRVNLTAKTLQALHAFSLSVLQSGLRTRATDLVHLSEKPHEQTSLLDADPNGGQFCSPLAADSQQQ